MKTHFKASIRKHPNSAQWHAEFYVFHKETGRWVRQLKSTRTTVQSVAKRIADEYQEFALRVADPSSVNGVTREYVLDTLNFILRLAGHPTVDETRRWDEYSQGWLELQKGRIAERSLESYESHIRQLTRWLERDCNIALNLVTGEMLQQWYLDMIEEGRKPATVNNTVKALQAVFDRAKAEGFTPRNPAELIMRQYGDADIREPFGLEDISKIINYLRKSRNEDWLTVTLLGLCTGQRLQDCAQADTKQFGTEGKHRVWKLKQAKTGAEVQVPIVEPLASHLEQIIKSKTKGFLAPSLAGVPSGSPTGLSMQFSEILNAAGVDREVRAKKEGSKGQTWTNKTFHSFRHTTNSLLANAGVSDDVRRKLLGHASTQMNARYTHMQVATTAEALQKAIATAGQ